MSKKYFLNFFFIIIIFCIDRISKLLVIRFAEAQGEMNINVTSFLNFNLIWNEGIAFGLFSFDQKIYYNLLTIFIFIIILIIFWLMIKSKGLEKFSFIMIIGGSLGNIFDRIYYSAVPDFIDIYFDNFHWFIFNVADIFISLGVIILISLEFFKKRYE
ncbi:signal peptidase II [Candidatus Pelagibacter communis]|uniref:signal peptidase II n=1 Tax=Pelagibacter ubique TaxID=198252 RepID=UPI000A4B2B8D|nr:signal peptidase II [Candidatus Pelagibacter ubique]